MRQGEKKVSQSSVLDDLAVLGSFLVCSGLFGLLFAWLITRPSLQGFFFLKGDKFLIPRFSHWLAFGLVYLLGLVTAYVVSNWRHWFARSISMRRLVLAALIIGLAPPILYLITPVMNGVFGPGWDFGVAQITFLILVSVAMCVVTVDFRLFAVAVVWNILFVAGALAAVYLVVQLTEGANERYEFVQWPILYSMLGLAVGNWLIWRERVSLSKAANSNAKG